MSKPTSYCLGCNSFQSLTIFYVIPDSKFYRHDLCFDCKAKLEMIIANKELQNGGWKEPKQLDRTSYFLLLKNFIMGEE